MVLLNASESAENHKPHAEKQETGPLSEWSSDSSVTFFLSLWQVHYKVQHTLSQVLQVELCSL